MKSVNPVLVRATALSFVALAFTGCASGVIKGGSFEGLISQGQNTGTVFVYRESSLGGAINQYAVRIPDVLVGSLPNGSFFPVNVEPGRRSIKADTGPFGKGSSIDVEAGKAYCMKLTLNFCFGCKSADITPVSTEQCNQEMRPLARVILK